MRSPAALQARRFMAIVDTDRLLFAQVQNVTFDLLGRVVWCLALA